MKNIHNKIIQTMGYRDCRLQKMLKQIVFESKIWQVQKNKKVCSYFKIQKCLHPPINGWKDGKFGN